MSSTLVDVVTRASGYPGTRECDEDYVIFYKKLKNVSCEYDRVNG